VVDRLLVRQNELTPKYKKSTENAVAAASFGVSWVFHLRHTSAQPINARQMKKKPVPSCQSLINIRLTEPAVVANPDTPARTRRFLSALSLVSRPAARPTDAARFDGGCCSTRPILAAAKGCSEDHVPRGTKSQDIRRDLSRRKPVSA